MSNMVFCRGCAAQIHATAESCPKCGAPQSVEKHIIIEQKASEHSAIVLFIVCFLFGFLGIHRFLVGKIGTGILMLLTFGGFGIWILVDLILILVGGFTDKNGNKITFG